MTDSFKSHIYIIWNQSLLYLNTHTTNKTSRLHYHHATSFARSSRYQYPWSCLRMQTMADSVQNQIRQLRNRRRRLSQPLLSDATQIWYLQRRQRGPSWCLYHCFGILRSVWPEKPTLLLPRSILALPRMGIELYPTLWGRKLANRHGCPCRPILEQEDPLLDTWRFGRMCEPHCISWRNGEGAQRFHQPGIFVFTVS